MKERERKRKRERLKSLKWGALIIGPRRCLSRQPFPGTLLEMSTAGNWIRLAVRVEPRLTDAQTGETLKWQMFPLLLKPECKAVTSRYRLSDEVWGLWQSSGLLKSEPTASGGRWGGVTDAVRKASFFIIIWCLWVFGESSKRFTFFVLIKGHLHQGVRWANVSQGLTYCILPQITLYTLTPLHWCRLWYH